ncbi:MAG TPA: hypothetical protein VGQ96_04660 [Candidatus Eremiobacteraceae bacterium]|nr:hypothetical protein [Candidatus Eremiobacteraceae bacterium]
MLAFWVRMKALWSLRRNAARVGRLFLDQRVPVALKALTALAALLIVSPVDLLGDIPVIGVIDDTLLLMLLAWLFVRFCPPAVVAEYSSAAASSRLKNVTPN